MTKRRGIVLALGLGLALIIIGIVSAGSASDEPTTSTTSTSAATLTGPPGEEPLSTLPTPENVQTLVFERAFSECASYDVSSLAGKYNVAIKNEENIALAAGEGWARQFDAGQDAVEDGRDGCLQGFRRSREDG